MPLNGGSKTVSPTLWIVEELLSPLPPEKAIDFALRLRDRRLLPPRSVPVPQHRILRRLAPLARLAAEHDAEQAALLLLLRLAGALARSVLCRRSIRVISVTMPIRLVGLA